MIGIFIMRFFGLLVFFGGLVQIGWFIYNQIWPTEEFGLTFRSLVKLGLPIFCLFVGWRAMHYKGRGIENVMPPDLKCPELDASIIKARATMAEFISEVEKGIDRAFVKFPLKTPQGFTEHIWAYVHFYKDDRFNVSLANDPIDEQENAEGRRDVLVAEVEDWQIMSPDGTIRGAYSLVALFEYRTRQGKSLTPRMKEQKALLRSAT